MERQAAFKGKTPLISGVAIGWRDFDEIVTAHCRRLSGFNANGVAARSQGLAGPRTGQPWVSVPSPLFQPRTRLWLRAVGGRNPFGVFS
jgi:hypothetical protein